MSRQDQSPTPKERLSPAEWQLMRICWRLGRANVRQVLREDLKARIRDYRTILTFHDPDDEKGLAPSGEGGEYQLLHSGSGAKPSA